MATAATAMKTGSRLCGLRLARRTATSRWRIGVVLLPPVAGSLLLAGCSSAAPAGSSKAATTTTTSPTSALDAAILKAWVAAETAFYKAEADPRGLFSPALPATMVDPELLMVKRNLAGQESEGFIGRGPWNLGTPRVVSLGPNESHPTTATVVSCIADTEILVNESTGQAAEGPNGTPDWLGETSTMVLSSGVWKLSQQSGVGNADRTVACGGIS